MASSAKRISGLFELNLSMFHYPKICV